VAADTPPPSLASLRALAEAATRQPPLWIRADQIDFTGTEDEADFIAACSPDAIHVRGRAADRCDHQCRNART
jgi:hypothetical protein